MVSRERENTFPTVKGVKTMKATSERKAFEKAFEIIGAGVEKDEEATKRAGYPIYRSTKKRLDYYLGNGGFL